MIPLGEFLHALFELFFFPLLVFGIKVFYMLLRELHAVFFT